MLTGTVVKTIANTYTVRTDAGELHECLVRGKFRIKDGLKTTNPVAIGDVVVFKPADEKTEHGIIQEIQDRKNYILRKAILQKNHVHVLCANIDQAVLLYTIAEPRTAPGFADRFLTIAEVYHIPVAIILNKTDLHTTAEHHEQAAHLRRLYESLGCTVLEISALDTAFRPQVMELLSGKVNFLSGHSGSGKSSLLNLVSPGLHLRTQKVSDYHKKGQHTTTHSEMFPLEGGGYVIDSPGIKELGLTHLAPEELSHYYPEMRALLDECKFSNCVHINEPKCAVRAAVDSGEIAMSRYKSYLSMLEELRADAQQY